MLTTYIQFARCDVQILEYTKYTNMLSYNVEIREYTSGRQWQAYGEQLPAELAVTGLNCWSSRINIREELDLEPGFSNDDVKCPKTDRIQGVFLES